MNMDFENATFDEILCMTHGITSEKEYNDYIASLEESYFAQLRYEDYMASIEKYEDYMTSRDDIYIV